MDVATPLALGEVARGQRASRVLHVHVHGVARDLDKWGGNKWSCACMVVLDGPRSLEVTRKLFHQDAGAKASSTESARGARRACHNLSVDVIPHIWFTGLSAFQGAMISHTFFAGWELIHG
jgi:hypothetical protein